MNEAHLGKVVIVTGGTGGLGRAICVRLARDGMRIILGHRSKSAEAEAVIDECISAGGAAAAVEADVDSNDDCMRTAAAAIERWGAIHGLVNCAGRTKVVAHHDLDGLSSADFEAIFRTNLVGAFQMVRACEPAMRRHGDGVVVNISSLAGLDGSGSSVAYAASKAALNMMTKSLARALAPAIRINTICPGFMATPWFGNMLEAEAFARLVEAQAARAPLQRNGEPDEIAEGVAFFLGIGGRNITGSVLVSDAGLHLGANASTGFSGGDAVGGQPTE